MAKVVKFLAGLVLCPFVPAGVMTLLRVVAQNRQADTLWVALLAGGLCWTIVFLLLPRPMWIYVFGHELTHAVWAWLFGGEVKRFKVTSRGGHVVVTRMNFLIGLAPYFFPIYALLVAGVFVAGDVLWGWRRFAVWFHLLLGAAYAFHVSLTIEALRVRQSDVTQQGWFFSMVIILLGNLLVLVLGITSLTGGVGALTALGWWLTETGRIVTRLGHWW